MVEGDEYPWRTENQNDGTGIAASSFVRGAQSGI
jgi:hypothetical protein